MEFAAIATALPEPSEHGRTTGRVSAACAPARASVDAVGRSRYRDGLRHIAARVARVRSALFYQFFEARARFRALTHRHRGKRYSAGYARVLNENRQSDLYTR